MKKFATLALSLTLSVCAGPQSRADEIMVPDVKIMMGRVEAILVMNGYQAHGYARTEAPIVEIVDDLPARAWGAYLPGHIQLSRQQPTACLAVSLGHEVAHDATVKMLLIDLGSTASAREVMAEVERIAAKVEARVASDGAWLPNCLLRRGYL